MIDSNSHPESLSLPIASCQAHAWADASFPRPQMFSPTTKSRTGTSRRARKAVECVAGALSEQEQEIVWQPTRAGRRSCSSKRLMAPRGGRSKAGIEQRCLSSQLILGAEQATVLLLYPLLPARRDPCRDVSPSAVNHSIYSGRNPNFNRLSSETTGTESTGYMVWDIQYFFAS
jgi:hypothetical protein